MSIYKLSVEKIDRGCIYLEAPEIIDDEGEVLEVGTRENAFEKAYIPIWEKNVPFNVKRADVLEVEISLKTMQVSVIRKLPAERKRRALKQDLVEMLRKDNCV